MKNGSQIKLLISDFDGTLVNTFEANYSAYQKAFSECGLNLSIETYQKCFGLRYDDFMKETDIIEKDLQKKIRQLKGKYYPLFFDKLMPNYPLISFIRSFKESGGHTALASTARKSNLINALKYLQLEEAFDFILAGEDVSKGKPNPEIYQKILNHYRVPAHEALVFEDSNVGIEAAQQAGINYIIINSQFYGN